MRPRLLTVLPFLVVQALLGAVTGHLLGGAVGATLVGVLAAVAAATTGALPARSRAESTFRQTLLAACLIALHIAALYTVGDDGRTLFSSANAQLLAAGLALVACLALARRTRVAAAMSGAPDRRTVLDEDRTLELEPAPGADSVPASAPRVEPPPLEPIPNTRLRSPLALGVVSTALFIVATLFWIGDDGRHEGLGANAAARELPSLPGAIITPPAATGAGPAAAPADAEAADATPLTDSAAAGAGPALPVPGDAESPAATGSNAVAPSAARRECMAQIESAHLFLQIARQSADETQYARDTQQQIARMLKNRPVGPRTLARIAERMWATRESPERSSSWWSSQFLRCEAARSGGSWYVVKG